jgi:hypothetical protein
MRKTRNADESADENETLTDRADWTKAFSLAPKLLENCPLYGGSATPVTPR